MASAPAATSTLTQGTPKLPKDSADVPPLGSAVFIEQVSLGNSVKSPSQLPAPLKFPTIRLFERSTDAEGLSKILSDFQDELKAKDPEGRMKREHGFGPQYLDLLLKDIEQHNGMIVVCEIADRIVGFSACMLVEPSLYDDLEYIEERIGRITELYVSPDCRGQGIGKRLLKIMESILRAKGCQRVELGVMQWNTNAYAMYQKLGYRDQHVRMAKPL